MTTARHLDSTMKVLALVLKDACVLWSVNVKLSTIKKTRTRISWVSNIYIYFSRESNISWVYLTLKSIIWQFQPVQKNPTHMTLLRHLTCKCAKGVSITLLQYTCITARLVPGQTCRRDRVLGRQPQCEAEGAGQATKKVIWSNSRLARRQCPFSVLQVNKL